MPTGTAPRRPSTLFAAHDDVARRAVRLLAEDDLEVVVADELRHDLDVTGPVALAGFADDPVLLRSVVDRLLEQVDAVWLVAVDRPVDVGPEAWRAAFAGLAATVTDDDEPLLVLSRASSAGTAGDLVLGYVVGRVAGHPVPAQRPAPRRPAPRTKRPAASPAPSRHEPVTPAAAGSLSRLARGRTPLVVAGVAGLVALGLGFWPGVGSHVVAAVTVAAVVLVALRAENAAQRAAARGRNVRRAVVSELSAARADAAGRSDGLDERVLAVQRHVRTVESEVRRIAGASGIQSLETAEVRRTLRRLDRGDDDVR